LPPASRVPRVLNSRCGPPGTPDGPGIVSINRQGVPGVSALSLSDVDRFLRVSVCFRVSKHAGVLVAYMVGLCSDADCAGEEFLWFKSRFPDFDDVDQVAVAREARGRVRLPRCTRTSRDLRRGGRQVCLRWR